MSLPDLPNPAAAPPPVPHRRPRVREVSSRFMSPLTSSTTTTTATPSHRSKSVQRRHPEDETNETIRRSLDTPKSVLVSSINRKHQPKSRQKLFKENGDPQKLEANSVDFLPKKTTNRLDTPNLINTDRIIPSRYKQPTNQLYRSVSAATRLLQEATAGACDDNLPTIHIGKDEEGNDEPKSCPNSPICKPRVNCSRSLEFRVGNGENNGSVSSSVSSWGSSSRGVLQMGVLPPRPKLGALELRRGGGGKKGGGEDVHELKLMHNRLLQWRLANAKAEACMEAHKVEAERQLYGIRSNIEGLRETVERKRIELDRLRRIQILSTVLQGHMPTLNTWSELEEDYSSSLSDMTNALLNTSLRLPVSGVQPADVSELAEVLDSASKVMEMMASNIQPFIPKAEETDDLSSELAGVAAGEKALVEECGSLVFKTHASQVNEWSLRGHMIQVNGTKASST